ncbi:MAG: hypothetical protein M1822_000308 [Bathelium mastoideum]|nr:MAG: hypothetical protein M1822_000308 [Bathelium mastoideum]
MDIEQSLAVNSDANSVKQQSSLQLLNSIDRQDGSFTEKLYEAATIIEFPTNVLHSENSNLDGWKLTQRQRARFEWVLRWLLDKLQSPGEVGHVARDTPEAWRWLRLLCQSLPRSRVIRQLLSTKLFSSLEQCLDKLSTHFQEFSESAISASPNGRSSLGKRKRSESLDRDTSFNLDSDIQKRLNSFLAVVAFLDSLHVLLKDASDHGHQDAVEQFKAVARNAGSYAPNILSYWLRCINHIILNASVSRPTWIRSTQWDWLQPILPIWESQKLDAFTDLFSENCLIPAAQLAASLTRRIKSLFSQGREDDDATKSDIDVLKTTLNNLERLLAKHIYQPMIVRVVSSDHKFSQKGPNTSAKASNSEESKLNANVENFDSMLVPLSKTAGGDILEDSTSESIRRAVPGLLDIAIRSSGTSRTTQQKRLWVETAFISLARCLGILTPANAAPNFQADSVPLVVSMLQILRARRETLSTNAFDVLIEKYSGLTEDAAENKAKAKPNWDLIAAVLGLDADVFLPLENLQRKRTAAQRTIPDALLKHLTAFEDPITDIHVVNRPRYLVDSIKSPETLIDFVVFPLMQGYAQRRVLERFLRSIFLNLQAHYQVAGLAYLKEDKNRNFCSQALWEDARVAKHLMPLIEKQFTPGQVASVLDVALAPVLGVTEDNEDKASDRANDLSTISGVSAGLLLIKLLVEAITSDTYQDQLLTQFSLIHSTLLKLVKLQFTEVWRAHWLVWRLLSITFIAVLRSKGFNSAHMFGADGDSFIQTIGSDALNHAETASGNPAAYEALSFLASLRQHDVIGENLALDVDEYIERAATFATDQFRLWGERTNISQIEWDGQPLSIQTLGQLALAYSCVFVRFPAVLQYLNSATRKTFFRKIYDTKTIFGTSSVEDVAVPVSISTIWRGLKEYAVNYAPSIVRDDFFDSIEHDSSCISAYENDTSSSSCKYLRVLADLQGIPLAVFKRNRREQLLNSVTDSLVKKEPGQPRDETYQHRFGLVVRLMQVPNATADLSMNFMTLWKIASVLDGVDESTDLLDPIYDSFEELARLVFGHHLSTIDQSRSHQYLADYLSHAKEVLKEKCSDKIRPGTIRLLTAVLILLDNPKASEALLGSAKEIEAITSAYIDTVSEAFQAGTDAPHGLFQTMALQAAFLAMSKLPRVIVTDGVSFESGNHNSLKTIEVLMQKWLDKALEEQSATNAYRHLLCLAFRALAERTVSNGGSVNLRAISTLLSYNLPISDRCLVLDAFKRGLHTLDMPSRYALCHELLSSEEELSSNRSSLFRVLLTSLEFEKEGTSNTLADLRILLPALCDQLLKANDMQTFSELSDCLLLVLREKRWLVSQNGIDTNNSMLLTFNSSAGPRLPVSSSRVIYRRLCAILHAAINRHRANFGGRFELLLPLLAALLGSLFIPDIRSYSARLRTPPWLTHSTAGFGAEEGAAFASLLTSLCEPTVSSVTATKFHRGKPGLTDETRKARDYAGQFVQDLLTEFCQAQLRGRLRPEVRKRLMPGIYAAISVVSEDGLRAMNASMDGSTRALWKSLYDDWRRFGVSKER